ncbi:uncharacterized protein BDZ83DRAFT_646289 [Colletotrichum acutatum]|uniref:Uncharacterized protein n=1 Tax=Glomerella acutata TaxID=27357 RepID=A0AAD8XQ17_GLOAC|nr:uncharacterized protein BDZ83DRAFT_646289 [Colletotrichum acutatum]KAK1731328.1 hypothetical protein BDZ83DRAFT_646289 [Colletotrichum acutatum]
MEHRTLQLYGRSAKLQIIHHSKQSNKESAHLPTRAEKAGKRHTRCTLCNLNFTSTNGEPRTHTQYSVHTPLNLTVLSNLLGVLFNFRSTHASTPINQVPSVHPSFSDHHKSRGGPPRNTPITVHGLHLPLVSVTLFFRHITPSLSATQPRSHPPLFNEPCPGLTRRPMRMRSAPRAKSPLRPWSFNTDELPLLRGPGHRLQPLAPLLRPCTGIGSLISGLYCFHHRASYSVQPC